MTEGNGSFGQDLSLPPEFFDWRVLFRDRGQVNPLCRRRCCVLEKLPQVASDVDQLLRRRRLEATGICRLAVARSGWVVGL